MGGKKSRGRGLHRYVRMYHEARAVRFISFNSFRFTPLSNTSNYFCLPSLFFPFFLCFSESILPYSSTGPLDIKTHTNKKESLPHMKRYSLHSVSHYLNRTFPLSSFLLTDSLSFYFPLCSPFDIFSETIILPALFYLSIILFFYSIPSSLISHLLFTSLHSVHVFFNLYSQLLHSKLPRT